MAYQRYLNLAIQHNAESPDFFFFQIQIGVKTAAKLLFRENGPPEMAIRSKETK
ncbi:MAG: hypothetical protein PHP32_04170 [Candidatus Izemoplasmatales bacterium]|nr:hypothetical protein [Candidatus Izemoplasmatales bacterium]